MKSEENSGTNMGKALFKRASIFLNSLPARLRRIKFISIYALAQVFEEVLGRIALWLLNSFKSDTADILRDRQKASQEFEDRIWETWGDAIILLELLHTIALEEGTRFNEQRRPDASKRQDYVFDVLTRLHARACLTTFEVITLLRNGFASGAFSRWRTLHELAVIARFILEQGSEVAERYWWNNLIQSYKAAHEYQGALEKHKDYFQAAGFEPMSAELQELTHFRNQLRDRFGPNFTKGDYGWAAKALGVEQPSFAQIEKAIKQDYVRPFYRLSSYGVHAQPKGAMFDIALPQSVDLLIAGPSIFGLADPGQWTAISLYQVTHTLLISQPSFRNIITLKAMETLADEICEAFGEALYKLEGKPD